MLSIGWLVVVIVLCWWWLSSRVVPVHEDHARLLPIDVRPEGVYRHSCVMSVNRPVDPAHALPRYFKYKESVLVPVRNQGKCASCWAYAVSDVVADRLSLATGGVVRENLSVQELLSCFRPEQFSCAVGGIPEMAYGYVSKHGLSTESAYPYQQKDGGAMAPCLVRDSLSLVDYLYDDPRRADTHPDKVFVNPSTIRNLCVSPRWWVPHGDTLEANVWNMKTEIFLHGPICGTLMVYDDLYDYDGSSVYKVRKGARFRGGHAIEIFGWSDGGANTIEKGFEGPYWICRNSWGFIWPRRLPKHSGWFYVRMGSNEASIEARASSASPVLNHAQKAHRSRDWYSSAYLSYDDYANDPERVNFFADVQKRDSVKT